MKGKTKTYLLLIAFLGIWGTIGYKVISALHPKETKTAIQDANVRFAPSPVKDVDTFSIRPLDRDPFLGTLSAKHIKTIKPPIKKVKANDSIYVPIQYFGVVAKQGGNEKVYVLGIDGQQHIMKIGQELQGITLLRASDKDIQVSYKGTRKTISKL